MTEGSIAKCFPLLFFVRAVTISLYEWLFLLSGRLMVVMAWANGTHDGDMPLWFYFWLGWVGVQHLFLVHL